MGNPFCAEAGAAGDNLVHSRFWKPTLAHNMSRKRRLQATRYDRNISNAGLTEEGRSSAEADPPGMHILQLQLSDMEVAIQE